MAADRRPTAHRVLTAVRELAGPLRDRSDEIEAAGELPADVVAALRAAGVFRLWMPVELGGFEATPAEVVEVVQVLAAADGSTGWCAATGIASNIAGALLSEPAARAVFASPDVQCGGALMPGGVAVRQPDGGYLVDGRWSFGSGIRHCEWVIGAAQADDTGRLLAVLMPAGQVCMLPTWQAIGLDGTGSIDYLAEALPVPADHCIDLATVTPWPAGGMWRIPVRSLLYPLLAAVPLGIGRRALSELVAVADRVRFGTGVRLADREPVQAAVGRAQALIESSSCHLSGALQRLHDVALAGSAPTPSDRATARAAAAHATAQAREAVTLCYQTAGTVAVYRQHPLQRAVRDVLAASQHYALSEQGFTLAGKVSLGFDPDLML